MEGQGVDAPIAALRGSSLSMLSTMLNPVKIIPTESGLPRDWRGLAELGGVSGETMSYLQSREDPTAEMIKMWCKNGNSRCTMFTDLKAFLAVIDRFDVAEDLGGVLESDALAYKEGQRNGDASVLDAGVDKNILTIEDSERAHQRLPLTRYDAFVLFADEDSVFANQVIEKMEGEYGLKLCLKDRDLLPGVMFEHEVIGRLIEERCNRFLVIFSPNFLRSAANQFLVSYAQASALESRMRKIVPCVYEQCELPPSVRYCFSIKYSRSGRLYNFWDRLGQSLKTAPTSMAASTADRVAELEDKLQDPLSDESLKLWDATKQPVSSEDRNSPPPSYSQTFANPVQRPNCRPDVADTQSISTVGSNAHLLSSSGKSKKWYERFKNPIKSKKQAVAE